LKIVFKVRSIIKKGDQAVECYWRKFK